MPIKRGEWPGPGWEEDLAFFLRRHTDAIGVNNHGIDLDLIDDYDRGYIAATFTIMEDLYGKAKARATLLAVLIDLGYDGGILGNDAKNLLAKRPPRASALQEE